MSDYDASGLSCVALRNGAAVDLWPLEVRMRLPSLVFGRWMVQLDQDAVDGRNVRGRGGGRVLAGVEGPDRAEQVADLRVVVVERSLVVRLAGAGAVGYSRSAFGQLGQWEPFGDRVAALGRP